eukprot:g1486.t1
MDSSEYERVVQFCRACRDTCARGTVAAQKELLEKENAASGRVAEALIHGAAVEGGEQIDAVYLEEKKRKKRLLVLVSIQALANMSMIDKDARSVAWRALSDPRSRVATMTTLEQLLKNLSQDESERSKKALGRLMMLVYRCITTPMPISVDEEEPSSASSVTANANSRLLSFLRDRGTIFAWLRALCGENAKGDREDYDASEWGLLIMHVIVESRGALDTTIRSIFGDVISKTRLEDETSESALAMFLGFVLLSWTHDEKASKKEMDEGGEDEDEEDEEDEEEEGEEEEDVEDDSDDGETKDEDIPPRVMHEVDARALAKIARALLLLVDSDCHSCAAIRAARGAALELCAELSCNSTLVDSDEEDAVAMAVASAVRRELLPAIPALIRRVVAPMSPGSRRIAKQKSVAGSQKRAPIGDANAFAVRSQTVKSAMRLIANCSFRNRTWQDAVREAGGIEAVLNCTHLDERDPILREWALLAVRNLCESNRANQSRIESIKPQTAMQDPTLKSMGYEIRLDEATGKCRLERTGEAGETESR